MNKDIRDALVKRVEKVTHRLEKELHLGEWWKITHSFSKLWPEGEWGFGACGSWRMSQILRHILTVPSAPLHVDELDRFLALQFADAVRSTLLESGTVHSKNRLQSLTTTCC